MSGFQVRTATQKVLGIKTIFSLKTMENDCIRDIDGHIDSNNNSTKKPQSTAK